VPDAEFTKVAVTFIPELPTLLAVWEVVPATQAGEKDAFQFKL